MLALTAADILLHGSPDDGSGNALLERLWGALAVAPVREAPLVWWLLLGALRPWHAAAREWAFTASPAARQVRPFIVTVHSPA